MDNTELFAWFDLSLSNGQCMMTQSRWWHRLNDQGKGLGNDLDKVTRELSGGCIAAFEFMKEPALWVQLQDWQD